ncbi:Arylacetamide deacetylase-like 4 isoform X1 [Oopsacas minuta]|uniref:Arylacetamide deacetylase-like 4 isoform X1 n=1 Tax=Oopsacas minuta TaxID=111878 RepID=A0AAV7JAU4_9METZ|nr:Arylacetamide deacetylase-like 4 isoform X1 [Oopsacas minuta]
MVSKVTFITSLIILIVAVVFYSVLYGCDLEKEHDEIACLDLFLYAILPVIGEISAHVFGLLDSWGVIDFKFCFRLNFDIITLNYSIFLAQNVIQIPITTQEWEINGLQVYSYTPNDILYISNQPLLIYFHGGGGAILTPKDYDASMRYLSDKMKLKIISPHYPRSPEFIFPTAHEECLKIVTHIFENSDTFGVDKTRISLGGDSFGGHVSLYVAFKWKELGYNDKYAPILTLSLIYPWVQFVNPNLESFQRKENSPRLLSKSSIVTYSSMLLSGNLELYNLLIDLRLPLLSRKYTERQSAYPHLLPKIDWEPTDSMIEKYSVYADNLLDPYATLLFQPDYTNLPPTLIVSAEYDILLTEGQLLRERLEDGGVGVEYFLSEKMFHGFFSIMPPVIRFNNSTLEAYGKISDFLHKHIHP